ncbi:CpXC domain-containing protein [Pseudosulfitobacter koreensis]|uniref:CpXC domain-containing protein n=1 Tax=Pseudosulfitobacter koreensis TaxID=2968472 RepID=A0ABT1Z2H1_9RHOB|nr:CpXC domain-containing protein [Pseudosulfitobacter koreense]MCR8827337.1 CpXC domain-containing protein [Pseudosulfitobacter koreense]
MSLFTIEQAPCPNCGTIAEMEVFSSVNGDRRVDLTEAILAGTIQSYTCTKCETTFRIEPSINYLSVGEGLWMMARPLAAMAHWKDEEEIANASFDEAYGSGAPDAAKEIGELLTVRLSFGWPAFREKVLIAQHGLQDVTVEMMKLAILRTRPANPLAPGVELRLLNVRSDQFEMGWINAITNEPLELFTAQKALYDEVDGNGAWAQLASDLSAGSFVDTQRLTIVPEPMEPAD